MSPPRRQKPGPQLRPRRRARGQAAAMMAATMMLIALMVCVTLGVGMKVKEKAEVQTLADVSAYSGAVMAARTFNAIAILNRAEVAEMVSGIGTQSLVSYSSYYRAMVMTGREQFVRKLTELQNAGLCGDICGFCPRYQALIAAADAELIRINQDWDNRDIESHDSIVEMINGARSIFAHQQDLYNDLYDNQLVGTNLPPLANAITGRADQASLWQGELSAPASVNVVNQRELGKAVDCDPAAPQAICYDSGPAEIPIKAAMGSRWYELERNTTNLADTLQDHFLDKLGMSRGAGEDALLSGFGGSTRYQSANVPHGPAGGMGLMGEALEGNLELRVAAGGCAAQVLIPAHVGTWVYSTSILNDNDDHVYEYTDAAGNVVTINDPNRRHALLNVTCTPPPPVPPCGMWPGFMDLNPGHLAPAQEFTHLWGQPKVVSVVQRDYSIRPGVGDRWNLLYTMQIGRNSSETFDNRGMQTAVGLDISRQTAIATGLVYYHRQFQWKEPPNFFNPYWRATLVSSAIDSQGNPNTGTDLRDAVSGAPFAQQVIDALQQQGFRAWQ